ncbi:MAG TPA: hypothetical protein VIL48_00835 [Acidimicrobiales bacterium]
MSLWTPSGEHPVDRPGRSSSPPNQPPPGAGPTDVDLENLTPEQREQLEAMSRQVEEARRQLVQAPAGPVVGQQALQFYELAALHLSQPQPKLDDARIAIDALTAVVEKLGSRLGEAERPLRQAAHQLQLAFVEAANRAGSGGSGGGNASPGSPGSDGAGDATGSGGGSHGEPGATA